MSQPWTLHIQIMFVYPTLYCDNLSALYMTVNLGPNMVTILLDKRWLEDNYLHIQFVRSKDQLANIHTKALKKQVFAGLILEASWELSASVEDNHHTKQHHASKFIVCISSQSWLSNFSLLQLQQTSSSITRTLVLALFSWNITRNLVINLGL